MGLNVSNQQIAEELSLDKDDVHEMTSALRQAVADKRPEVQLSGTVEFDEVQAIRGSQRRLKKRAQGTQTETQRASGTRYARNGETADLRDDSTGRRRGY